MDPYIVIITICMVLISSFFFNILAKKTNLPSVLMLLVVGMGLKAGATFLGYDYDLSGILEILGIIGLIMIVLEAALDLPLSKEKWPLIRKSFWIAFFGLFGNVAILSCIFMAFIQNIDILTAMLYSTPLSILSSAIVIPSVSNLCSEKREFMVYESTFSDILGIMFFYLLLGNVEANSFGEVALHIVGNLSMTLVVSLIASLILLFLFQKLTQFDTRFALFLSILILIYSIGKMLHLSSLIIILIFGLILRNHNIFIRGKMTRWFNGESIQSLFDNFIMITEEAAFVIRTFFFVLFGMSISLESLTNPLVLSISAIFFVLTFGLRFILMRGIVGKKIYPETFIAPRGLISILLFFAIPEAFHVPEIESGTLFCTIISTSLLMGIALMHRKKKESEHSNIETESE